MEVVAGSSSRGAAASSSGAQGSQCSASTKDMAGFAATPDAKRRRRPGPGHWSDSRSKSDHTADSVLMDLKEELFGSDDESAPPPSATKSTASADGVGELDRTVKVKACCGCFRSIESGRDWASPDERVTWGHPNNRGSWCRDCFNLWRLRHSSDRSLIVFRVWLRQSENYAVWEIELIAYVSLVAEGISRVSNEALGKRIDLLKWLSSFLCIPFNITEVVPLFAIQQQEDGQKPMSPAFLTTTIVDGKHRLALHTTASTYPSDEQSLLVERPAFAETMTRLPARRWVATDSEEDHRLLATHVGCSPAAKKEMMQCKVEATDLASATLLGKSRLYKQIQAQTMGVRTLFLRFGYNDWADIKESSFTLPTNKMYGLQGQAEAQGDQESISLSQTWCAGLQSAKLFLGRHREFVKAKSKNARLVHMHPNLDQLFEFLQGTADVEAAPGLKLLRFKILFWHEVVESKLFSAAAKLIFEKGFGCVAKQLNLTIASTSSISIDYWMRSLLINSIVMFLSHVDPEAWDEPIKKHYQDIKEFLDVMQADCSVTKACGTSLSDVRGYASILQSTCEPKTVQIKSLAAAVANLSSPHMKVLKLEFHEGGLVSKNILACAACLLQVSAQDQVGDNKMKEAMALLQDENLPFCFSDGAGDDACDDVLATVKNFQFLSDQSAIDVFDESLRCISEAVSLWSNVQAEAVQAWIVEVDGHLRFFDELLCLFQAGLFNLNQLKPLFFLQLAVMRRYARQVPQCNIWRCSKTCFADTSSTRAP